METPLCRQCHLRPPSRPGRPFCSKACSNRSRKRPASERFLDFYQPAKPEACWPWTGPVDRDGYGVLTGDDRRHQLRAHRLAFERVNGTVPAGQNVLHKCDNPPCCNPAHLFLGSAADNTADMVQKGRQLHGSTHPMSKLTDADVRTIRGLYPAMTQTAIARRYGLDQTTVSDICSRKIWRHI